MSNPACGWRASLRRRAPTSSLGLKNAGLVVIPTVGARRHAEKVAEWGVDGVIAQGAEGGGHTGEVPTTLLVPQVVEAVGDRVAVVAAGGFHSGAGLVAALAWGASGIAMGTRFLLTQESTVPDDVKKIYLGTPVTGTVVTRAVDGAPQRVVRTELVGHLEGVGAADGDAARRAECPWLLAPDRIVDALVVARGPCSEEVE